MLVKDLFRMWFIVIIIIFIIIIITIIIVVVVVVVIIIIVIVIVIVIVEIQHDHFQQQILKNSTNNYLHFIIYYFQIITRYWSTGEENISES